MRSPCGQQRLDARTAFQGGQFGQYAQKFTGEHRFSTPVPPTLPNRLHLTGRTPNHQCARAGFNGGNRNITLA